MPGEHELSGRQAWPTMFFFRKWVDHPAHAPDILKHVYELKERAGPTIASGVAPAAKPARGLFESDFDFFQSDRAGVRKLLEWLDETARQVVSIANGQRFRPEQVRVEFTEAWAHVSNDGGYHDAHYHGGCSWCGTYYLQAGNAAAGVAGAAGNGVTRFYSPLPTGGMASDVGNRYLTTNRIDIIPTDGLLVLFPSYLLHSGLPYSGEQDRVVVAFNSRSTVVDAGGRGVA
jgi:uncharacterized protein (TIGR02466 family)